MANKKHASAARWALDSNVLIAMFKKTEMMGDTNASERSQSLIEFAFANNIPILVSTMAIVEVYKPHPKRNTFGAHPIVEDMDDFLSRPNIELIEVGRAAARISRDICNELGMPSWDAVHLACAVQAKATTFFCWDDKDVLKHKAVQGVNLARPTEFEKHALLNTKEEPIQPIEELPLFFGADIFSDP